MRAETLEAREEGRLSVMQEIRAEQHVYYRRTGMIRKKKMCVVRERLFLGKLAITPHYEYEHLLDEHIDKEELGMVAEAVRTLAGLPDLTSVGVKVLEKSAGSLSKRRPKS